MEYCLNVSVVGQKLDPGKRSNVIFKTQYDLLRSERIYGERREMRNASRQGRMTTVTRLFYC